MWIKGVAKAGQIITTLPAIGDQIARRNLSVGRFDQGIRASGGATVTRPRQGGQATADGGVQVSTGGGDHPRRERRHIELMFGT